MGQKHSACVSSCSLYMLMERKLLDSISKSSGLLMYGRYHDDILLVSSNLECAKIVIADARLFASACYTIEIDEISLLGVPMLDMYIYKGQRFNASGRLDFRPYIKPTARHLPLTQHSAHAPSIHSYWPIAEISRMWRLSLHRSDFEVFRATKCERFENFRLDKEVLTACRLWSPIIKSAIAAGFSNRCHKRVLRVIFPYHRLLNQGLSAVLSGINDTWNILLQGLCPQISVRAGFKNFGVPLMVQLQRSVDDES